MVRSSKTKEVLRANTLSVALLQHTGQSKLQLCKWRHRMVHYMEAKWRRRRMGAFIFTLVPFFLSYILLLPLTPTLILCLPTTSFILTEELGILLDFQCFQTQYISRAFYRVTRLLKSKGKGYFDRWRMIN